MLIWLALKEIYSAFTQALKHFLPRNRTISQLIRCQSCVYVRVCTLRSTTDSLHFISYPLSSKLRHPVDTIICE